MIIKIPYGVKPGEKIVNEGFWACPVCQYKRPYVRKKVVKVNYFGLINIPSSKALMEYIHCGGCLNVFPIETADPENQLKVELLEQPLPPDSFFNDWQMAYQNLECDQFLSDAPNLKVINSPLIKTSADQMQKAGVAIKLKMFDDAKICLYNVLTLYNQWLEYDMQRKGELSKSMPENAIRHKQFSEVAHYLLSKLP
ncbi:MAG: hypothetical protein IT313_11320 [Anaerolineales bacterium]|nr:hypothetical protein [Anaerolineales bacterium]